MNRNDKNLDRECCDRRGKLGQLGTTQTTLTAFADHLANLKPGRRIFAALAGPPASGKSTAAEHLVDAVTVKGRKASILQMDGFHFDDAILAVNGQLDRKGAPETFDVSGFVDLLWRLHAQPDEPCSVPVFDRDLELSRGAARIVYPDVEVVIVEGNYVLLDAPGWNALDQYFDVTAMLSADIDVLERRLLKRWDDADLPSEVGRKKVFGNDLPNARLVMSQSRRADFWIATDQGTTP